MSEIRSVSVHLDADVASYVAKMRLAGAETDKAFGSSKGNLSTLNRQLTGTVTRLDKVSSSASKVTSEGRRMEGELDQVSSKVTRTNRNLESGARSIDKYSGRLSLLVSGLAAVGPALVPLGAGLIPLVTTATADIGFLSAAGGVTELAFHGLGSALNAFNKASLQPTAANIQAAQLAMDKLPPSAQAFVLELHRINPELDRIRQSAASGVFPGLTAGLRDLTSIGPEAERTVHGIGLEMGTLAHEAGQAIAGPEGRAFLRYFGREAPLALHQIGQAAGYGADGVFHLVKAFTPLTHDVNAGIVALARDFDRWATSLGRSKDFQSFLAYIEANGPKVISLLGNTGTLLGDIVKAAAPLGGPTLDALNLIVKALDLIASSPVATPLLALLQLNSILKLTSSGMRGLGINATIGLGGITKGATTSKGALSGVAAEAKAAGLALRTMGGNIGRNAANGTPLAAGVSGSQLATLAKGVGLVAGAALVASGAASKLGATNTATYALAGSIAGPLGAAVGTSVGAFADWRAAVSSTDTAIKSLQQASNSFDISGLNAQIGASVAQFNSTQGSFGNFVDFLDHKAFGGTNIADQQKSAIAAAQQAQQTNVEVLSRLFTALNGGPGQANKVAQSSGLTFTQQMAQTAARAQPAMDALGISVKDLQDAAAAGDLGQLTRQIVDWTNRADSATGRTDAVANAFAAMADKSLTADQRIQSLSDSLDSLLGPGLNLSQASDQFQKGLNDITGSLAKHTRTLRGNSDAAIQNRAAIRGLVTNSVDLIKAQAEVNPNAKLLTRNLIQQRNAILAAGAAAGLSKSDMEAYLKQLGLTPKLIKTTIAAVGMQTVESQLQHLTRDRTIHITVQATRLGPIDTTGTGGKVLTGHAAGGTIPGPRSPYGDKMLIMAAPGEEMISNRHGQADQFRADRAAGRIPHYGFGGTIGTTYTPNPSSSASSSTSSNNAADNPVIRGLTHNLAGLSKSVAASTKTLDAERQTRQNLVSAERQLASSVTTALRGDIFSTTGSVWDPAGGIDPLGQLRTEITGDRQFDRLLHQLHRRGVRGGALAALAQTGSVTDAQVVAAYSNRQLHQLTSDFRLQQRLSQRVGQFVGQANFGQRIAEQTAIVRQQLGETKHLRAEVHQTNKELAAIKKEQTQTPAKSAAALNNASSHAARRVKRGP